MKDKIICEACGAQLKVKRLPKSGYVVVTICNCALDRIDVLVGSYGKLKKTYLHLIKLKKGEKA